MTDAPLQPASNKLPHPRLLEPRMIRDGIAWLRVFAARVETIEAPFYGVNVWRVKRKHMASSVAHLIKLAGPGLNVSFGDVHYLKVFPDPSDANIVTVVLIYDWHSLPKVIDGAAPLGVLIPHFSFIRSVEGYNWNLIKDLEPDLANYADMLAYPFHSDICA